MEPILDITRLEGMRSSLAADGYELTAAQDGGRIGVRIAATAGACPGCLVPKQVMAAILGQVLDVPSDTIDLTYPTDEA